LSCFDALAKEGKHTCFHIKSAITPAKYHTFCALQITKEEAIPLTTQLMWVSSPRHGGSKVANDTASQINTVLWSPLLDTVDQKWPMTQHHTVTGITP